MFCNCVKLESLPDITNWDFSKVENIRKICYNCKELVSLPEGIEKKYFNKVKYNEEAFDNCDKLTSIPKNIIKSHKDVKNCIIY